MILCIETATNVCSVALCDEKEVISVREEKGGKLHSAMLTVYINEILSLQKISPRELQAVAVSKGPGSFTGLRIGVSVAKGISYGAGIPLIGVDTLTSLFYGIYPVAEQKDMLDENTFFCPMIHAKGMEVFYCIFNFKGEKIKEITAETITNETFREVPDNKTLFFFGDGADKCIDLFNHDKHIFIGNFTVSASFMHKPAIWAFNEKKFENIAYFEPFYLKDFIATKAKRKVI